MARVGKKPSKCETKTDNEQNTIVMTIPRMKLRISDSSERPVSSKSSPANAASRSAFLLYLQRRGNRAYAPAEVVTNNETDGVFPGSKLRAPSVGDADLGGLPPASQGSDERRCFDP